MSSKTRVRVAIAAAVVFGFGCDNGPGPTSGFDVLAIGHVTACAQTASGAPLDSVLIFPKALQSSASYSALTTATGPSGEILVTLERMVPPSSANVPDTVTVEVRAQIVKRAYLNAQGVGLTLRDTVLLTFVPPGQSTATPAVTFTFTPP